MDTENSSDTYILQREEKMELGTTGEIPTDAEPLIEKHKGEDVQIKSFGHRPWQYRFGLIEMVQVTYFVSGVTSLPLMEQYLYARFLGSDSDRHIEMSQRSNACGNDTASSNHSLELYAQKQTSKWMMMTMAVCFIPAVITTYFWGVYSDLKGRRLPMMCASIGSLVKFIILLFVVKYNLNLWFFIVATVLDGCTGFFATMLTCVYSFIADVSTIGKERSRRLLAMEVFNGICVATAQFGFGFFMRSHGFFYPLLTLSCLQLVNVLIVMFIVPETCKQISRKKEILSSDSLKRTVNIFLKKSPKGRRIVLFTGVATMILLDPALMIKRGVEVLYVLRSPLCWDAAKIGVFTALSIILQMVFVAVALRCLQKTFRDVVIAMFGALSSTANVFVEAFAKVDATMYVAAGCGLLSFISPPIIKGLMSEKIAPDEQGSMFSGLVSIQFMFQGVGLLLSNTIYMGSVEFMPGLVFLVIAVCSFTSFIILGYLSWKTAPSTGTSND